MFVNPKELKKLMKEAHRINHLIIGCRDDLYYIQGFYWKVLCKKKFVPKTIQGVMQRLLQFPGTRNVYLINDRIVQMTKGKHYDEDQGETPPEGPYCHEEHGVFWENDVMKFSACFRVDYEHFETLQQMNMIRLWNVNQEPER